MVPNTQQLDSLWDKVKKAYRNISPSLRILSIAMLSLFILFSILKIGKVIPPISMDVNIQKIEQGDHIAHFEFDGIHLIKLLLLGPVYGLIYFALIQLWLHAIDEAQKSHIVKEQKNNKIIEKSGKGNLTRGKKVWIELWNAIITCGIITGTVIHWLFDKANFFYHTENSYDISQTYGFIYFCDEYLAHSLIHISYFLMILLMIWMECLDPRMKGKRITPIEWGIITLLAIGVSVLHGFAALQGESALILWIVNGIAFIVLLLWGLVKKIRWVEHPVALIQLLVFIGVTISNIIFISRGYVLPEYPFITYTGFH